MKVIRSGKERMRKWWIGKRIECTCCGRIVELEENDEASPYWRPMFDDSVMIECAKCGLWLSLKNTDGKGLEG